MSKNKLMFIVLAIILLLKTISSAMYAKSSHIKTQNMIRSKNLAKDAIPDGFYYTTIGGVFTSNLNNDTAVYVNSLNQWMSIKHDLPGEVYVYTTLNSAYWQHGPVYIFVENGDITAAETLP